MDSVFLYRPDAYLAAIVTTMFFAGLILLIVDKHHRTLQHNEESGITQDLTKPSRLRPTIDS